MRLAEELEVFHARPNTAVLGIPRGGVVVAAQIARELELPLGVAVAAKVGAPGNPEYAAGAVTPDGAVVPNPGAGYSAAQVRAMSGDALAKARHEEALFGGALGGATGTQRADSRPLRKMTVILADDGLATGLTAIAASAYVRSLGATRVVLAVPVASAGAVELVRPHVDEVVVLSVPPGFSAVGQFYARFGATEDDEVVELLRRYHGPDAAIHI